MKSERTKTGGILCLDYPQTAVGDLSTSSVSNLSTTHVSELGISYPNPRRPLPGTISAFSNCRASRGMLNA
jgi:hypothetical protein